MSLPKRLTWDMAQDRWSAILDPVVAQPFNQGIILKSVSLAAGANVVNHKLGRTLQGWIPTRVRASATIYDTQDSNQTPQTTLNLTSSAAVVVDLLVF